MYVKHDIVELSRNHSCLQTTIHFGFVVETLVTDKLKNIECYTTIFYGQFMQLATIQRI
jgi:hypothetical protein